MGWPQTTRAAALRPGAMREISPMQDILWIGLTLGLLAATLAYAGLCDNA
jgi:hypothetical protein